MSARSWPTSSACCTYYHNCSRYSRPNWAHLGCNVRSTSSQPLLLSQLIEACLVLVPIEAVEAGLWCEEEHPANTSVLILVSHPRGSPQPIVPILCSSALIPAKLRGFCKALPQ